MSAQITVSPYRGDRINRIWWYQVITAGGRRIEGTATTRNEAWFAAREIARRNGGGV